MKEQNATLNLSLEAKHAALFVSKASQYASTIQLKIDSKMINAKSIMGIISLGLLVGQEVTVVTDGSDEDEAMGAVVQFLQAESARV